MGKYFGTDGIRGVVNKSLNAELAFKAGAAASMVLAEAKETGEKPLFTIGKDTRISSDMLESAIIAGLCSAGADVLQLGVIPAPAVAHITIASGADAGIMISASHNPYEHNGIKIFNCNGYKLSDELENEIESLIDAPDKLKFCINDDLGRLINRGDKYIDLYIEHVLSSIEGGISDLKVMIDCANGAAVRTVNDIFGRLSIELELIKDRPDGCNINDKCGSTHIENLGRLVVAGGYDVGLAFDGDADRCLAVDENGRLLDGDKIMAICGKAMLSRGELKHDTIVATVMSNIGFHEFCNKNGLYIRSAPVGDRNVLDVMQKHGFNLGGEQSGHIIFLDDETTGDGQLAALKFLKAVSDSGKKVSKLAAEIPTYPQVLINVSIEGGNEVKKTILSDESFKLQVEAAEKNLGDSGRVLVRPSGTEALIRVMVESSDAVLAESVSNCLADCIRGKAADYTGEI